MLNNYQGTITIHMESKAMLNMRGLFIRIWDNFICKI